MCALCTHESHTETEYETLDVLNSGFIHNKLVK